MLNSKEQKSQIIRTIFGVVIMSLIAAIHIFRFGSFLEENLKGLYYAYFSDIIIPFGIYFLLCINEISIKFLRSWKSKSLIIFLVTASSEILQGFDFYLFGTTFDYFDFIAYAFGIFLAVIVDEFIFKKYISNWDYFKKLK